MSVLAGMGAGWVSFVVRSLCVGSAERVPWRSRACPGRGSDQEVPPWGKSSARLVQVTGKSSEFISTPSEAVPSSRSISRSISSGRPARGVDSLVSLWLVSVSSQTSVDEKTMVVREPLAAIEPPARANESVGGSPHQSSRHASVTPFKCSRRMVGKQPTKIILLTTQLTAVKTRIHKPCFTTRAIITQLLKGL